MRRDNEAWDLEQFLDSLILELDKAQDTLSLKGLTRKLTYTVKDVGMDLNIFPVLEDGKVKFQMVQPGETGGSRISFQLGSITDRQIRESANEPPSKDDLALDALDDVDDQVKRSLRKVGVNSSRDLEKLDQRNVNIEKIVREKTGGEKTVNYQELANLINKARRRQHSPALSHLEAKKMSDSVQLQLKGENFVIQQSTGFPIALVNGKPVRVLEANKDSVHLDVSSENIKPGVNQLDIALDPYAVMKLQLNA